MKALRLRNLDKPLEDRIRALARRRHVSCERAAMILLRRGAGLEAPRVPRGVIGNSLDKYFGGWSDEDVAEFEKAVAIFEVVDPEAWK